MRISIHTARFPKAIGDLSHSVQFFKFTAFAALGLSVFLVGLLAYSVSRPVGFVALSPDGSAYRKVTPPKAEDEISEAIRAYIERRYNWTSRDVESELTAAQAFILPSQRREFQNGLRSVIQFAGEKPMARRVYSTKLKVDLEKKMVFVSGDRIAVIQGLWAANELKLSLNFESGPRTVENPWGVYVTKEKEE